MFFFFLLQKWAQFYLAEIFLAIEYLHENSIVYRDIKPENVMLDSKGHARLIDFGLCKIGVSEDEGTHTRTHCGTNSYMAPEILDKGQLYGPAVDWWSFGILAFDMMCGGPPWKGKDKYETYRYEPLKNLKIIDGFLNGKCFQNHESFSKGVSPN